MTVLLMTDDDRLMMKDDVHSFDDSFINDKWWQMIFTFYITCILRFEKNNLTCYDK